MALSRQKKEQVIAEVSELLSSSKMTVLTEYQGTPVKALQDLRRSGRDNGTVFKIAKNRLVRKAIESNEAFKDADTSALDGMLLYAFNREDEVAPAQTIAEFAKKQKTLKFVGALTAQGVFIDANAVQELAELPSKPLLIAQVVSTLLSPLHDITSGLSGNIHALLDGVEAKATN